MFSRVRSSQLVGVSVRGGRSQFKGHGVFEHLYFSVLLYGLKGAMMFSRVFASQLVGVSVRGGRFQLRGHGVFEHLYFSAVRYKFSDSI